MKLKSLLTTLAAVVGISTAAVAAGTADENGIVPQMWFKFDGNATNIGSNGATISPSGTYEAIEEGSDDQALVMSGAVQSGGGAPTAYPLTVHMRAQLVNATTKLVWSFGGKNMGGINFVISGEDEVKIMNHSYGNLSGNLIERTKVDGATSGYHYFTYVAQSGSSKLYYDGVLVASSTSANTAGNGIWGLGKVANGTTYFVEGIKIADLRTYNVALTDAQIAKIAGVESKTYKATISGETTWSEIVWDPALEGEPEALDVFEVTGSGTDAVLTFGSEVSYSCKLSLLGDAIKIKAADSFYEDGCWIKEFAKFSALTCETEPTFADIKEGYKGAYAKTSSGFTLRGQNKEVISINIAGGSGGGSGGDSPSENLVSGSDFYGIAPTIGDSWNNINRQWQSGGNKTISIEGPNAYDGESVVQRETMSLSATGKNTWQCGSISNPFLRGYLDDGNGVTVTVHGIPYTSYDVIVYATSDDSSIPLAPITINGTQYTYKNGAVMEGSDTWGVGKYATPEIGKNALRVDGCSGDTLTINATRTGGRGTLCAVQVICTGEVVFKDTYTATISGSTTFENITWDEGKTFKEGQLNEATITVGDSSEDEVEITFGNPEMSLAKLDIICSRDIKFTADSALSNVGQFIITGCTAKVTYAWPVSALATSDKNVAYAGGTAGDAAVGISHGAEGTALNLVGGTYKISETHSDVEVTYNVTDSILNYPNCIGLGKGTYNIGGTSQINTLKFVLVQGSGNSDRFNLSGDAQVNVSGTTISDSNQNSVMFGHWGGDSTFTISDDAVFTAEGTQILIGKTGGDHTINVNGGTITTKGIRASGSATGANTLNLNGGSLVLGEIGIAAYGSTKINVNVTSDSKITSSAATKITQPITVGEAATLLLDASAGDIVISGAVNNGSIIEVTGGDVIFMSDSVGTIQASGTGMVFYGVTVTINNMGTYTPVAPLTTDNVKLYDEAGKPVEAKVVGDHLEFDWKYTDGACWWDYEFNGNGKNTGSEGTSLSWDGDRPKTEGAYIDYVTNIVEHGETAVTNISLKVPQRPWRDISTSAWPAEATYMFYGKMVGKDYSYQLAFGSKNSGGNQLFFATRSVADGTVDLCYSINGAEPSVLCTMNVPNAQASDHLYAVVIKDDGNGNSIVNTYLDGTLLQPYTHEGKITLGGGFQIASGHGGTVAGDYGRPDDDDPATIDWLRVYDVELNASVMTRLAEIYPYISTNGKATRTVTSADTAWVENDKWQQAQYEAETLTTNAPFANTMVEVTVNEATTLALNLATNANYEALEIGGTAALTLTGADGAVIPSVSGTTTIGTDVTVAYDAIKFGNVTIAAGKTLTFDFATLDLSQEFASRTIKLTGVATLGAGASIDAANIMEVAGRTTELVFDSHTSQYSFVITVEDHPFVYTIAGWTWNGVAVSAEAVSNSTAQAAIVQSDLEWTLDRATFTVEAGTLKAAAVPTAACAVTVEVGATFDLNGIEPTSEGNNYTVTLNGGTLANSGETLGLLKALALTANSTIDTGVGKIAIQSQHGGWAGTALDLGTYTLTKTGTNRVEFVTTTVSGTGTIDVQAGTLWTQENASFGDALVKLGATAAFEVRSDKTATVAKIDAADGAQIVVHGTISGFELSGSVALAGAGSFGTITNAADTVVNVGTRHDLTFAGEGTVNVTLTDDEFNEGEATIFTLAEGATTKIGTVMYNGKDVTQKCKVSGGKITAIRDVGTIFYIVRKCAVDAASDVAAQGPALMFL